MEKRSELSYLNIRLTKTTVTFSAPALTTSATTFRSINALHLVMSAKRGIAP